MNRKNLFAEIKTRHLKTLVQYVPIVARVHGKSHPEFYEVRSIFNTIYEKTQNAKDIFPNLDGEFSRLREVTNNYLVPDDVCESYQAVYLMLKEVDQAYHQEGY